MGRGGRGGAGGTGLTPAAASWEAAQSAAVDLAWAQSAAYGPVVPSGPVPPPTGPVVPTGPDVNVVVPPPLGMGPPAPG